MAAKSWIITGVVVVALIVGVLLFFFLQSTSYKDCGTNNDCFLDALKECTPAKGVYTGQTARGYDPELETLPDIVYINGVPVSSYENLDTRFDDVPYTLTYTVESDCVTNVILEVADLPAIELTCQFPDGLEREEFFDVLGNQSYCTQAGTS